MFSQHKEAQLLRLLLLLLLPDRTACFPPCTHTHTYSQALHRDYATTIETFCSWFVHLPAPSGHLKSIRKNISHVFFFNNINRTRQMRNKQLKLLFESPSGSVGIAFPDTPSTASGVGTHVGHIQTVGRPLNRGAQFRITTSMATPSRSQRPENSDNTHPSSRLFPCRPPFLADCRTVT